MNVGAVSAVISRLGDAEVFATAIPLLVLWLAVFRLWRVIAGLLGGLAVAGGATLLLKSLSATPGQTLWPEGAWISQYFPSGHTSMATAVYMSAAMLLARQGGLWRIAPVAALLLAALVGAARVAGGLHPLGDVAAGFVIGLAGPLLTTIGLVREQRPLPHGAATLAAIAGAFAAAFLWPLPISGLHHG